MSEIFATVQQYFTEQKWPTAPLQEKSALQMNYQGDNGQWVCIAWVREEEQQFIFYSVCPIKVPEEKRPAVAEFVTRANYDLMMGNFEMGYETGELRFKTAIDLGRDQIDQALINQLVFGNVLLMDRYLPGIMNILQGNTSPEGAIAQIEQRETELMV